MYPFYQIKNKLRVIELFGGVGSQISAVEELFNKDKTKYEHWKLCEWAYNSYCAYNSIHIKDFKDYSQGTTKDGRIVCYDYGDSKKTYSRVLRRDLSFRELLASQQTYGKNDFEEENTNNGN